MSLLDFHSKNSKINQKSRLRLKCARNSGIFEQNAQSKFEKKTRSRRKRKHCMKNFGLIWRSIFSFSIE
jgi:hypothetical protein